MYAQHSDYGRIKKKKKEKKRKKKEKQTTEYREGGMQNGAMLSGNRCEG